MSEKTPDKSPRPAQDSDADQTRKDTGGDREEWTGGQRKRNPGDQDADPAQLPELEVDEDSIVSPENS